MEKVDLNLLAVINRIISDFPDSSQHYLMIANYSYYFDELTNFAPVYFNSEFIEEIQLTEDGLNCKFSFHNEKINDRFTIKIPYNQIGRISKCDDSHFIEENVLFLNEEVMLQYYHSSGTMRFFNN